MTHQSSGFDLIAPILIVLLTATLTLIFGYKRKKTSIHALDWLIAIFGSVALLGIFQTLKLYFHDSWGLFVEDSAPRALDIVTTLNLVTIIILFFMSESFLAERPNPLRLVILTILTSLYFSLAIYYISTGTVILTNEVFPFAKGTSFDSLIFDTIQVFVLSLLLYVFGLQYKISDNKNIRKYLTVLLLAIALYYIAALMELGEHFANYGDISAFIMALPTFLILAYFYLANPNFVYMAPANIAFLQIVSSSGQLLYAAELTEELNTNDFLVGPSLTSMTTIISELVDKDHSDFEMKQFTYIGGVILFEQVGNLRAILQTDRPSQILKRSMRYFLREFDKHFSDQIENYKGYIQKEDGYGPDDLFVTAIPIVMSKAMSSNFSSTTKSLE